MTIILRGAMKNIALVRKTSFWYNLHTRTEKHVGSARITPGTPAFRSQKKEERLFYKNEKEAQESIATAPRQYSLSLSLIVLGIA
jgi:hypothetical protein